MTARDVLSTPFAMSAVRCAVGQRRHDAPLRLYDWRAAVKRSIRAALIVLIGLLALAKPAVAQNVAQRGVGDWRDLIASVVVVAYDSSAPPSAAMSRTVVVDVSGLVSDKPGRTAVERVALGALVRDQDALRTAVRSVMHSDVEVALDASTILRSRNGADARRESAKRPGMLVELSPVLQATDERVELWVRVVLVMQEGEPLFGGWPAKTMRVVVRKDVEGRWRIVSVRERYIS